MQKIKDKEEVGKFIKGKLNDLGMKQIDLAEALSIELGNGYSKNDLRDNVSKWITGRRYPGIEYLYYLSKILKVGMAEILTAGEICNKYEDRPFSIYAAAKTSDMSVVDEIMNTYTPDGTCVGQNYDEYDKTILDYAIEFENLKLIQYLFANHYVAYGSVGLQTNIMIGNIWTSEEIFFKIVNLAIKHDDINLFKSIFSISKNFYISDVLDSVYSEHNYSNFCVKLPLELYKKILNTKKIFNYLTNRFNVNKEEWEQLNPGVFYKDKVYENIIINDKLQDVSRYNTANNILLDLAIKNEQYDKVKYLIKNGIEGNKIIKEELGKYYNINDLTIDENGNVIQSKLQDNLSITVFSHVTQPTINLIKDKDLKKNAELLISLIKD